MNLDKEYFTTEESAYYLTEIRGLKTSPKSLRTAISRGGSPKFFRFGRKIVYTKTELDLWAESKLSPLMANSSQVGAR